MGFAKLTVKSAFTAILSLGACAFAGTAFAGGYDVEINKTSIVHLPTAASAVIIGNPSIADVSVHSADTIFVVGRGYGETNIIVIDTLGQTVMNAPIRVKQGLSASNVQVLRLGVGRETYSCSPNCLPSPMLGDEVTFRSNFEGSGETITNSTASGISYGSQPFAGGAQPPYTMMANDRNEREE